MNPQDSRFVPHDATTPRPSAAATMEAQLPMALFLATVTTLYIIGRHLVRDRPALGMAALELTTTWIGQFLVSSAMLWLT